jgi:hypothetical protein
MQWYVPKPQTNRPPYDKGQSGDDIQLLIRVRQTNAAVSGAFWHQLWALPLSISNIREHDHFPCCANLISAAPATN